MSFITSTFRGRFRTAKRLGLRVVLLFALLALLYYQLFDARQFDITDLWQYFLAQWRWATLPYLGLALVLVGANWLLETQKWQVLLGPIEKIPFWAAFRAVMAGATFSLFTPNRVGEYGGRVLFVRKENKLQAVVASLVGTVGQWLVLLSSGALGLLLFLALQTRIHIDMLTWIVVTVTALGAVLFLHILYFRVALLLPFLRRFRRLQGFARRIEVLQDFEQPLLWHALKWAFLRYMVFSWQYYLLLCFFGATIPFGSAWAGIAVLFLLQTGIPLPPATGLVARGSLALYVWGFFTVPEVAVLAATFGLWLINVVWPASLGALYLWRRKNW